MSHEVPLRESWEARDSLAYHQGMSNRADAVIGSGLILPADRRWNIGRRILETGPAPSSLRAMGPPGTAKTAWGNLVFGSERRVDIYATDIESDLFGHTNPMQTGDSPEYIAGRMHQHGQLDPEDPTFFLNELTHVRNTRIINPIWDGQYKNVGGVLIPMNRAALYYTSNWPDNKEVHETGEALDSRTGAEILTGDTTEAMAREIQGFTRPDGIVEGVLPKAAARYAMSQLVAAAYPDEYDVIGNATVDLIAGLNETGLVEELNPSDKRHGQALSAAVRAYMFMGGFPEGTPIKALHVARVAALVLPTSVKLNHVGRENILDFTESDRSLPKMEAAIAVRRIIAGKAFEVSLKHGEDEREDSEGVMSPQQEKAWVQRKVERFSYANATILGYDMDQALQGKQAVEQAAKPAGGRRFGLRRK
jgi:hypothetical protein